MANPADYFMKIMNADGMMVEMLEKGEIDKIIPSDTLKDKFEERVRFFYEKYLESKSVDIQPKYREKVEKDNEKLFVSWFLQFSEIFKRTAINEVRNPLNIGVRIGSAIIFSLAIMLMYSNVNNIINYILLYFYKIISWAMDKKKFPQQMELYFSLVFYASLMDYNPLCLHVYFRNLNLKLII